jgi:putative transposase
MRRIVLQSIYPKAKLSKKHPEHRIYPYLLGNIEIVRAKIKY